MSSLFKKKKKSNKDETFLELKDSVKKLDISIKKKEAMVKEFKGKAKKALLEKNETLAKQYLSRKLTYERQIQKTLAIQSKLAQQMDAIEEAETMGTASQAMKMAVSVLNHYARTLEKLNIDEIMADSEESLAIIEEAGELMGEDSMDILYDDQVESEIDELQAELALEMTDGLVSAPDSPAGLEKVSPQEDEEYRPRSEDVRAELEKLKRELEI